MIEPIMYVGIGFLIAGLLVIGCIPLVHARAVRLTMRRLEALTPLSMAEIQADKDQLRAEFAMSTRRLEMSVEQMKAKTTGQLTDIGKKSEAIGRLKLELGEKTAALLALEAKEKQATEELHQMRAEFARKLDGIAEIEQTLAETKDELAQVSANYHESSVTGDSQRVELVALRAQVEVLKSQVDSYEKEARDLQERLALQTADAATLNLQLIEERAKAETLAGLVAELERQLVVETTEVEILNRRVQELGGRLDEQGRFLAEREFVSDGLRAEMAAAQKTEADVRAELAEAEKRHRAATESLRAEKTLVEQQLNQSHEERAKLQREIATMQREAETAWVNERTENAMLRERINDVAAEVARLTAALEGPDSPIEAIINGDAARVSDAKGANGTGAAVKGAPSIAPSGAESKGTLADRIRALQGRASRVPQPSQA